VIGGGATGAGVAWDAALRGFDVTLVDRADLAEGTSGRFHGLLHSGARYVVTDPVSARECAEETAILKRIASATIEPTGGLFVTTPYDDPAYADGFLAACRDGRLVVVPRATHLVSLVQPARFTRVLLEALDEVDARPKVPAE